MKFPTNLHNLPQNTSGSIFDSDAPTKPHRDIEKASECEIVGASQEIVDWDDAEDSNNPQNFKSREKWTIIVLVSAITFNQ